MNNTISERFFMRPEFDSFRIDPVKIPIVLFGKDDRAIRDHIKSGLRLAAKSADSEKYVLFGVAGRGKTQLAHNLINVIKREDLSLFPIYTRCEPYGQKASLIEFHFDLIKGFLTNLDELRKIVTEASRRLRDDPQIHSEMIAAFGSENVLDTII